MLRVDLLCDKDNRTLLQARNRIMAAFRDIGLPAHWHEWDIGDPQAPIYLKGRTGVVIFVNGSVVPESGGGLNTLIDPVTRAAKRLPAEAQITEAVLKRYFWPRFYNVLFPQLCFCIAVLPFFLLSLIPSFNCPLCWPGYTSRSGWYYSNNIGWHYFSDYLFPLAVLALCMGIGLFSFRCHSLDGYLALLLALIGGALVLTAKAGGVGQTSMWVGVVLWAFSIIWSLRQNSIRRSDCINCNALSARKRCA